MKKQPQEDNVYYAIEDGRCSVCQKTVPAMTEDGEDVIEHLNQHWREDHLN